MTIEYEEVTDDFDDEEIEQASSPFQRFRRGNEEELDEAERTADKPLTNREPIPLMPDADKKQARKATQLKITKLDPPNHGVKGFVHLGADEEYIANMWGDGSYNIEAVNNRGVTLQKREAVRIAMGRTKGEDSPTPIGGLDPSHALETLAMGHAQERARSDRMSRELLDRTTALAREHTQMVGESSKETRERDRQYHEANMGQMQQFFGTLLTQTQQTHERELSRAREEHKQAMEQAQMRHEQMMQMMMMQRERESEMNSMQFQLFRQGMELGQGMAGGENDEPWVKAIEHGVTGLRELRGLAATQQARAAQLPPGSRTSRRLTQGGQPPSAGPKNGAPAVQKSELARDIAGLKRECDKRGIDFRAFLRDLRGQVSHAPDPSNAPAPAPDDGVGQENQ